MPRPVLPFELHQLIIDIIGEEFVAALRPWKDGTQDALHACSLVCKGWRSETLQYIFYNANFAFFSEDLDLTRPAELFRILEINPSIRGCIRRTEIYLETGVFLEDVEALCNAISPIETLRVVHQLSNGEPGHIFPPLECLHPILNTHVLRDFSIWATHFSLRFLENATNLRSLTLEGVEVLDTENVHDGAWRPESSTSLEKLVLVGSSRVLTIIGERVEKFPGLDAFFKDVKHLEVDLADHELLPHSPWRLLLARWIHMETLVFHWTVTTIGKLVYCLSFRFHFQSLNALTDSGVKLFRMCQMIPWESFQGLRSLTYDIVFRTAQPTRLLNIEFDPSKMIFSGPSRLPRLQHLRVILYNRPAFSSVSNLCAPLDIIYRQNLNSVIEDGASFPSLQSFHTKVKCTTMVKGTTMIRRPDTLFTVEEEKLAQLVMDRLPAIFGSGGRKETEGWSTSIVPSIRVVTR